MKKSKGIYIALGSGFFWGVGLTLSGLMFILFDVSPFLVSFFHDFFSIIFLGAVIIFNYGKIDFKIFKSMKSYAVVFAAILAGPLGMQFNLYAVKYIGAGLTSSVTAIYPAVAVILSVLFLKHQVRKSTLIGIILIVVGLFAQTFETTKGNNLYIGVFCALICAVSWASESVLSSYAMSNNLKPAEALLIRQITSFLMYAIILIFNKQDFSFVKEVNFSLVIFAMVIANMISYLLYYMAINHLQPSKATGLNVSYVVWTVIFSAIFLQGDLTIKTIITSLIIILGVYVIIKEKKIGE